MATFLGSKLARGVSSKIKETFDQTTQNVRERMAQTASHQEEERTLTPEQVVEEAFQRSSKFTVQQKFEPLEALTNAASNLLGLNFLFCGIGELENKYETIQNEQNDDIETLKTIETSELNGWTGRCLCRPHHRLQLHLYKENSHGNLREILHMNRPCRWTCCFSCCLCCRQEIIVHAGAADKVPYTQSYFTEDGSHLLAYISEPVMGGILSPTLQIMDRSTEESSTIPTPSKVKGKERITNAPVVNTVTSLKHSVTLQSNAMCCIGGLCCDKSFQVLDTKGRIIGAVVKRKPDTQSQTIMELLSDGADIYTLQIPKNLNANTKAALLSSLHLLDYWLFEGEGDCSIASTMMRSGSMSIKCCTLFCCGCTMPIGCRGYNRCCWCPMICC